MQADEIKILQELRQRLQAMTPKQRKILSLLMTKPDHWWTRKELAHRLERPHNLLLRHDIVTLNWLWNEFLIEAHKDRIMDEFARRGQPVTRSTKGRGIVMRSQFWSYRVADAYAERLELVYHLSKPKRQSAPAQPRAVYYGSLGAWLKDKIGL